LISLTRTATKPGELPPLRESGGLPIGCVYVADETGPQLPSKKQAVLTTKEGGQLELLTSSTIGVRVDQPGTDRHHDDYSKLVGQTEPAMRL